MRKLTEEHKRKISAARKKFLDNNPDKVPYILAHSSKKSWPEKFFEELLVQNGITGWQYNYPFKRYRLDFAFPELKVDIEIDGSTHFLLDKVKQIDLERDTILKENGWRVLRIDARLLYSNIDDVLSRVLDFIKDDRIFGVLEAPKKLPREKKILGKALKERNTQLNLENIQKVASSDIDFSKLGWVTEVSLLVGVAPNKGGKWLKRYMPDLYDKAWKRKG